MEDISKLDKKLDVLGKILSLTFKLGVVLGSVVLLFYCWRIGYFPQDVAIGDGLLFILLAIAFGGMYLIFTICLTSLGLVLRPIWLGFQKVFLLILRIYERVTGKPSKYTPFTIEKAGWELYIFAFLGGIFVWGFSLSDIKVSVTLGLSVWGCALLWSYYQKNSQEIEQLERNEVITDDESKRLAGLAEFQPILLGIILMVPLVIGGVSGKLLDGAMRLANVRADSAVIHIKEPYMTYASEHGLKGEKSSFGSEFIKFNEAAVLFNGFGKHAVIQAGGKESVVSLAIPSTHIYIIQK